MIRGRKVKWLLVLGVVLFASSPACGQRTEGEVREFTIQVNGKSAGTYRMTLTRHEDNTESFAGQGSVRVRLALKTYVYTFQGTERWKDGRLLELQTSTNDDGKRYEVQATAEGNTLRLRVNGQERMARGDVWPTTHWRLADARFHNQPVPLLDADTGKEYLGRLQYLGVKQLTVGQQAQNCYHFRVTGGPSPVDLWYDGGHRLVRQEFTVEGFRTVFHLNGLRRQ
ncbi:MAG: DUF6134 family protein [Gemmataceae bacterium]|nr:DUF6134 family protein [Gemmataceae bacterium]